MVKKMGFKVVGRWSGDYPVVIAVVGEVGGSLPYVDVTEGYWERVVSVAAEPGRAAFEAAGEKAAAAMLAPIQPRLDAAEAFREELRALVVTTWRAASPPVYYQVGIGRIRDAIDEPYRVIERNFKGERHDWLVIEKIIKYCGGDVDHFRDLFVAAGWEIHNDD